MAEINLLPVEERKSESVEGIAGKLSILSVGLLVTTAVAALVTLGFFTTLISAKQKLVARIEESSAEINRFKTIEEYAVVTKSKVSTAEKIISIRTDQVNIFSTLSEIVPGGVTFTDIKFTTGDAILAGRAKSSADLANLVSQLLSAKGAEVIGNLNIDSLSADEQGIYSFGISGKIVTNAPVIIEDQPQITTESSDEVTGE